MKIFRYLILSLFINAICIIVVFGQNKIKYDYSCLEYNESNIISNRGNELEKIMLNSFVPEVSIKEEISFGKLVYDDISSKNNILDNTETNFKLGIILKRLLSNLDNPKGFNYKIILLKNQELNAFTSGGYIYITLELFKFCKSNDELASIIAHEIFHNELGHIADQIKKIKSIEPFGEIGNFSANVASLVTSSFNQKNELECDLRGIDLLIKSNYQHCANVDLWKRMSKIDDVDNLSLFKTHPYSIDRANCSKKHVLNNYNYKCN